MKGNENTIFYVWQTTENNHIDSVITDTQTDWGSTLRSDETEGKRNSSKPEAAK